MCILWPEHEIKKKQPEYSCVGGYVLKLCVPSVSGELIFALPLCFFLFAYIICISGLLDFSPQLTLESSILEKTHPIFTP